MRALEAATISSVAIGDRESEKTFNQQGVETSVIRTDGRSGRRAIQWFSYDLPVNGADHGRRWSRPTTAISAARAASTCWSTARKSASESQPQSSLSKFYEKEYVIPAELMRHKEKLTVRFEATNGLEVTPVFGVRLISASWLALLRGCTAASARADHLQRRRAEVRRVVGRRCRCPAARSGRSARPGG